MNLEQRIRQIEESLIFESIDQVFIEERDGPPIGYTVCNGDQTDKAFDILLLPGEDMGSLQARCRIEDKAARAAGHGSGKGTVFFAIYKGDKIDENPA